MRARILNSHFLILNFAFAALAALAACRVASPASVLAQGEGAHSTHKKEAAAGLKLLTLTHAKTDRPVVGTPIDATAEGLPPNRTVDLLWETVEGGWVVEDGYRFRGKKFTDSTKVLGRAQIAS